uniref:Uncharacterized protein n=1 Tax=Romanomermis culicivorax TaxID=13658 RepID=A0A915IGK2_ROMCU
MEEDRMPHTSEEDQERPRKDQCEVCPKYKDADENAKKLMQENYDHHLQMKKCAQEEKMSDKSRAKTDSKLKDEDDKTSTIG